MTDAQGRGGPTLGVAAISYNEERDLPGFLENLIPWVDEIVIVDDESTDQTEEIARAAGSKVKFIVQKLDPGQEGFSGQRNRGIEAAESDWLLHMDIDERVPPALAHEIRSAIRDTNLNAFRYRRLNFFLHRKMRGGNWTSWNNPQLARRGAHRFENPVHERCVIEGEPASISQLAEPIWHLCDESYIERMEKSFRYCQDDAAGILESGKKVSGIKLLGAPIVEFMKQYFWKRGFRDGTPGLISALHSSSAHFRAYALAWDRRNRIAREDLEEELKEEWSKVNSVSADD